MHARYVILRVLLENGGGLVKVEKVMGPGGDDIVVRLDRSKIETCGRQAIGDFLLKLQVNGVGGVTSHWFVGADVCCVSFGAFYNGMHKMM